MNSKNNSCTSSQLRQLRKSIHLTQALLAQSVGLSLRDIQNIEGGSLSLPYRKYHRVAQHFGVSVETLTGEEAAR